MRLWMITCSLCRVSLTFMLHVNHVTRYCWPDPNFCGLLDLSQLKVHTQNAQHEKGFTALSWDCGGREVAPGGSYARASPAGRRTIEPRALSVTQLSLSRHIAAHYLGQWMSLGCLNTGCVCYRNRTEYELRAIHSDLFKMCLCSPSSEKSLCSCSESVWVWETCSSHQFVYICPCNRKTNMITKYWPPVWTFFVSSFV